MNQRRRWVLKGLLMCAAFLTSADDQPLDVFHTTTGAERSVLSSASGTGFTLTYTESLADSRVVNRGMLSSARILEEGEWAVLTFTFDSTQIKPDQAGAFGWGFRFGNRSVIITARTGTPQWTFLSHRFTGASGFEFTTDGSDETTNFHTNDFEIPEAGHWFTAGDRFTVQTILKRIEGTEYEMVVNWGGRTYSSTAVHFTGGGDHRIESIFFRSGAQTGSLNDIGDNYTISDVQLRVIEQPSSLGFYIIAMNNLCLFPTVNGGR